MAKNKINIESISIDDITSITKKVKEKKKNEMLIDIMNHHLSKGNITKERINAKYKDKIKKQGGKT